MASEVDAFCTEYFGYAKILGVHYRGTDKGSEAPILPYDQVIRNINFHLEKYPETGGVFISNDDDNFINYICGGSINRPIIYRNDSFRSENKIAIHQAIQDKMDINRDAIVNCLLLSRCHALMKTASILSAWSKLFNPKLPLIILSQPYNNCRWFPERELVKDVLYPAIG